MEILNDGIARGQLAHGEWLFFTWNTPEGGNKFSVFRSLKRAEGVVKEKRLKGWLIASNKKYMTMHKILKKLGGRVYDEDESSWYFYKEIPHERKQT